MTTLRDDAGGTSLPHVKAAAYELGSRFGIAEVLGYGTRDNDTYHDDGRALDFMTRTGQALADYARANAARLGVIEVIWNQQIWTERRSGEGWRPMSDRGSPTANHKDHVHLSFDVRAGSSPTMPAIPGGPPGSDPAVVAALIDPLPWLKDKLLGQVDEATAAIVKTVSGWVIAGAFVAGGLALVVAGLARSAQRRGDS